MGIQARSMMSARTSLHLPRFSAASSRLASSIQFSAPASVLGRSFTRPKPKSTPTSTLQRDARNQQRRSYGTPILDDHDSSRSRFQPRVSHLFIGLAVLGLFVTTYGLLEWYLSFDSWPPELRDELRKAIKARNRGDFIRSEVAFRKAIDIANELPLEKFGEDPLLKVTGIHISLAALLENGGQQRKALEVLQGAMEWMDRFDPRLPTSSSFSSSSSDASTSTPIISNTPSGEPISWGIKDRTRSIGLLQKLGSISLYLAETVPARSDTYLNQAESYLTRALTSMIELGASEAAKKAAAASAEALAVGTSQGSEKHPSQVVGRDFLFPSESSPNDSDSMPDVSRDNLGTGGKAQSLDKVTKRSMGLVMESLADVYVRKGKYEFANALYVQAISTLLPPKNEKNPVKPSVMDTCQAAMVRVPSVLPPNPPTPLPSSYQAPPQPSMQSSFIRVNLTFPTYYDSDSS